MGENSFWPKTVGVLIDASEWRIEKKKKKQKWRK